MSTRRYLDRLFESCTGGYIELRAAPSGQRRWTTPGQWAAFGAFVTTAVRSRQDVYIGLATRRSTANGTEANLLELPALFLDIDQPPAAVRPLLEGFPFRPTFIVGSGAGTHLKHQFREPLDVSTPDGIGRAASLFRRAAAYFKADDRATSPAVAPRLVGSRNFKYGRPQPVTLLEESDARVNACELEDFLPSEIVDRKRNAMTIRSSIPVGDRHNQLFALARSLLCHTIPFGAVDLAVRTVNDHVCEKPLPDGELVTLLGDALRRPHRAGFVIPASRPLILHDAPAVPVQELSVQELSTDCNAVSTAVFSSSSTVKTASEGTSVGTSTGGGCTEHLGTYVQEMTIISTEKEERMDFDIRDYSKGGVFVQKEELRAEGPRKLTIESVEEGEGFANRDGKPPKKELVLVFTDGTKFQLTAATNKEAIADLHGCKSSGWIGKTIELYCDPSVRNPSGVQVGGIRIMRPDVQDADDDTFTSDLEEPPPSPAPARPPKGNGPLPGRAQATRPRMSEGRER